MNNIAVNEVFETFQGEAAYTGSPAIFLRLQGCNVGCPWCDTKHTWEVENKDQVSVADMLAKVGDSPKHAIMTPGQIAQVLWGMTSRHVVITGGEPAYWPLFALCRVLRDHGKTVQLETSGTEPLDVPADVWVTLSPKINMPGKKVVREDALLRANEIKMPVGKQADIDRLLELLATVPTATKLVWLQPLSQNEKATDLCMEAAREYGWRLSIQTHKFLGVR